MQIVTNGLEGLQHGAEHAIGDRVFTMTVLPVIESRKLWVAIQPMLTGIFAAEDYATEGFAISGVALAGLTGGLSEATLKTLSDAFMAVSQCRLPDDRMLMLKQAGAMDVVFGGRFDEMLEWLDFGIQLHFGSQLAKQGGALGARAQKRAEDKASKAEPKGSNEPA